MSSKKATTTISRRSEEPKLTQSEAVPPPAGVHVVGLDLARCLIDILDHMCSHDADQAALELYNTWKPRLEEIVR